MLLLVLLFPTILTANVLFGFESLLSVEKEVLLPTIYAESENPGTDCPRVPNSIRLSHLIHRTCPTKFNAACDDSILYDPFHKFNFRCSIEVPLPNSKGGFAEMNSSELIQLIKLRDPLKRNWCMITFFYSHNCPFSAKIAPEFNDLHRLVPNLLTVAIDASEFSRLNFRYGIAGTPTILFWVNGMGVARMNNNDLSMKSLLKFIQAHTDLAEDGLHKYGKFRKYVRDFILDRDNVPKVGVSIKMERNKLADRTYTAFCTLICIGMLLYNSRETFINHSSINSYLKNKLGENGYRRFLFYMYLDGDRNIGAARAQEQIDDDGPPDFDAPPPPEVEPENVILEDLPPLA
ncbi:unnamed protein product [Caenorhabditis bovis]|uniref:Thioredoxin domain-containing protein n=1 Tax=Caenorhabditis bovis TaxID=2654633 RepID=A0A8S1F5K9_9PELO|nr:unnamed protein product [Caenorhabditis bovis]